MYFDRDYDPQLFVETTREALLFRDSEANNLILKTSLEGQLPPDLAWVFPLPSKPLSYKEADPKIFQELRDYFNSMLGMIGGMPPASIESAPRSISKGIKVHKKEIVGDYQIVPIEILSEKSGGEELNAWLRKQKFIELPAHIQKPYLKKGAFFLAIKIKPKGSLLEVKPLWVRYKSQDLSFPLRFTHDYRQFDMNLYFIVNKKEMPRGLQKNAFRVSQDTSLLMNPSRMRNPEVYNVLRELAALAGATPNHDKQILSAEIKGVNSAFKTADLKEDPGF